jgi:hypothetical protein
MRAIRYLGAYGAFALLIIALEAGGAQPYSRQELLNRGNNSWQTNCVVSAMNYYAILQQFPGWPDPDAIQRMRNRIGSCRRGSVGMSSTDSKNDGRGQPSAVILPPMSQSSIVPEKPRARACRAYAATALAQVQAQMDGQCNQGGARWSTDYSTHYNWCMQAGTPQTLRSEYMQRSNVLNVCVFRW